MPCLGLYIALDSQQAVELKAQPSTERMKFLREKFDLKLMVARRDRAQEADEAWDPIHRALTDGTLKGDDSHKPQGNVILGGEPLYNGSDYVLNIRSPQWVQDIAAALEKMTKEQLRAGYHRINPDDYGRQLSEDDFEFVWAWFQEIVEFYRKSAVAGYWIVFTTGR